MLFFWFDFRLNVQLMDLDEAHIPFLQKKKNRKHFLCCVYTRFTNAYFLLLSHFIHTAMIFHWIGNARMLSFSKYFPYISNGSRRERTKLKCSHSFNLILINWKRRSRYNFRNVNCHSCTGTHTQSVTEHIAF